MGDLYLVMEGALPAKLRGSFSRYSLAAIGNSQLLQIEDRFFKDGKTVKIPEDSGLIVIPDVTDARAHERIVIAEFGLALLTTVGHPTFRFAAMFSGATCTRAWSLPQRILPQPSFVATATGKAAAQWLHTCMAADANLKDRLFITAHRYVAFATAQSDPDSLLDLCISLESLLDSQTEVSFRFGVSLTKVTGMTGQNASDAADLLSELYTVRSKLAHGDPTATKLTKKIDAKLATLRRLATRILTIYILYASNHNRDDWKKHLKAILFA